jgi:hypothetical protein
MINKNNGGINHDSLLDLTSLVDFCLKNGRVPTFKILIGSVYVTNLTKLT